MRLINNFLWHIFAEVAVSLGDNKIKKEWGGKYDTAMVQLLLILSFKIIG